MEKTERASWGRHAGDRGLGLRGWMLGLREGQGPVPVPGDRLA
jgi:hypothetical protein